MKSSNSYLTVISAETMEKLPDRNIAEIVRRSAGVAMEIMPVNVDPSGVSCEWSPR
jgi:outer membrane receptor for ferrienterochelin and colicin